MDRQQRGEDGGEHREVAHGPGREDEILEPGTRGIEPGDHQGHQDHDP